MSAQPQRVAIVGGGVAGIVAAYLLQARHRVSLFEKGDYLGGHTHTIEIGQGPDAGLAVDTGFIVFNDRTYPLFETFLERLGVAARPAEMSFGFQCRETGLVYAGNSLNGLFAQRRNLARPGYYRFLLEILHFSARARRDLFDGALTGLTLGEYLQRCKTGAALIDQYLLPMAAAIWSTPALEVREFPAEAFFRFFSNHGLLSPFNRPQWKTVVGGSFQYIQAFVRQFPGELRLGAGIARISRENGKVQIHLCDGRTEIFDQLVLATHADQALRLLADPSPQERRLLAPWRYHRNHTILHTDSSVLPRQRRAWAAWNFTREAVEAGRRPVAVTYYMNLLQGLRARRDYCVTLNPTRPIPPARIIAEFDYLHPHYDFSSLSTQAELPRLNGQCNSWFCGSYFGYGFHEDAVRAAVAVGEGLGGRL